MVTASPATQVARVVRRDGVSEDEARARLRAQLPQEEKLRVATHVIDNDGDLAATEAQVERVLAALRARDGARRSMHHDLTMRLLNVGLIIIAALATLGATGRRRSG